MLVKSLGATTCNIKKKKQKSGHNSKVRQHRPGLGLLDLSGVLDETLPGQRASQPVKEAEAKDLEVTASGWV